MQAINGNVFVKRDAIEEELFDIKISENLLAKNLVGVVEHAPRSDNYVIIAGDRVHLPHIGVEDLEFDGAEYAVAKESDLFAKEVDGVFQPINRFVKIRKCTEDHVRNEDGSVLLHMTRELLEFTHWVEIVAVAPDCEMLDESDVGMFCIAPETDNRLCRLQRTKEFMLHEELIRFTSDGDCMIKPHGDCVILEKCDDGVGEFGVKTEECVYTVISFGTGLKTKKGIVIPVDLEIGERVIVSNDDMPTLEFDGKTYYYTEESNVGISVGE